MSDNKVMKLPTPTEGEAEDDDGVDVIYQYTFHMLHGPPVVAFSDEDENVLGQRFSTELGRKDRVMWIPPKDSGELVHYAQKKLPAVGEDGRGLVDVAGRQVMVPIYETETVTVDGKAQVRLKRDENGAPIPVIVAQPLPVAIVRPDQVSAIVGTILDLDDYEEDEDEEGEEKEGANLPASQELLQSVPQGADVPLAPGVI